MPNRDERSRFVRAPRVFDAGMPPPPPAPEFLAQQRRAATPPFARTVRTWKQTCFWVAVAIGLAVVGISMLALAYPRRPL